MDAKTQADIQYEKWMSSDAVDEATKEEIASLDEKEREFRFFAPLSFGTAGLRGKMYAGLNAMNVYTVARATQGFASYINGTGEKGGVAVCRDSRNNSELFARTAAEVLAANGIKVWFFDGIRPTPVLSFAVRHLHAAGGINITASHNPKEYNGYKVYWSDGAQISLEQAEEISGEIEKTDIFTGVRRTDFDEAVKSGMISMIGEEIDRAFLDAIKEQRVNPEALKSAADALKIVYTPLNGTGYILVPQVLREIGVKNLYTVDEQMTPDGNFPTVPFPNPELPEVFEIGIKKAEALGSDLIIATDPDADRVGVMARGKNGFEVLTGNQTGVLLLDYIFASLTERGLMPEGAYAVKTIVTSEMAQAVCDRYGVRLYNVLTGFKFIGGVVEEHEEKGDGTFLFGYEESYGYLKGTHARDKDAVVASMLIAEMAAYYYNKGMTLIDAMNALYEKYGYYRERTDNIYMEGLDGLERMAALMDGLRADPPVSFGGEAVTEVRDYRAGTVTRLGSDKAEPTGLPTSNVLYYRTAKGNSVILRPSGTEPKIKVYLLLHAYDAESADALTRAVSADVAKLT